MAIVSFCHCFSCYFRIVLFSSCYCNICLALFRSRFTFCFTFDCLRLLFSYCPVFFCYLRVMPVVQKNRLRWLLSFEVYRLSRRTWGAKT